MMYQASLSLLMGLASLTYAQSCGGGGSFTVNNVSENFGSVTLQPRSAYTYHQGNAQICIVNRAPNTVVTISGTQVNGAISAVLNKCCTNAGSCHGGQQKITGPNGNVIDLSVQGDGQNCTA
ncbi:hypothetical protein BGZ63DRAFT_359018 [Mariannaea sp. PMI_226]|nr:hypothetical protein BGZ63DRAFT_359018 [Mariannaea sp. PMI_226]